MDEYTANMLEVRELYINAERPGDPQTAELRARAFERLIRQIEDEAYGDGYQVGRRTICYPLERVKKRRGLDFGRVPAYICSCWNTPDHRRKHEPEHDHCHAHAERPEPPRGGRAGLHSLPGSGAPGREERSVGGGRSVRC